MKNNNIVKNMLQGLTTASSDTIKSYVSVGCDLITEIVKDELSKEFTADEAVVISKAIDLMASKGKKNFNERNLKPREIAAWRSLAFGILQAMEASEIEEAEREKIRAEWEAEDKKNREEAKKRAAEREIKSTSEWLEKAKESFKGHKPGTWLSENK